MKSMNGQFWNDYKIIDSPGDGHCLLHSFVKSFNSQHANLGSTCVKHLMTSIEAEVELNCDVYVRYIRGNSKYNLINEMRQYVYDKVYKTSFGDIVPDVITRIMGMNLIIISTGQGSHDYCTIVQAVNCSCISYDNSVFIYKSDEHYDTIVSISERDVTELSEYFNECHHNLPHNDISNVRLATRVSSHNDNKHLENNCENYDKPDVSPVKTWDYEMSFQPMVYNTRDTVRHVVNSNRGPKYNFTRHAIKFCSWNVYGLHENKLCDGILGAFLKLHDMIFVTETWASDEDSFNLDGYAYHNFSRKVKHTNA